MRYQSLLILTELLSLSLSVSWRNNSSETGDNVSDVTRTFIFSFPLPLHFLIATMKCGFGLFMVESLSVELNASRFRGSAFETERVRRPDILGLTREAIFLGLTVSVY